MNDEELFKLIAKVWVENGGDAEGFAWCWTRILSYIKQIESKKESLGER